MKKSLSLLVAIAMVFSMFATVAAAATDTQSKYNELKEAGVFRGTGDGSAALENEMTRAEFAGIIARLTGVTSSGTAKFNDVPSSHWASKDIAAVAEAGYMEGTGNNNFAPSKNVTLQELIKVAVTIVGLEIDEDATVDGKAGAWAQPYIAAAIAAGLIQPLDDYTVNATRGDLVDVTYEVYQVLQNIAKVTGYEVVSATKVVVSFSDGGEVEVELDEPLKLGKNTITVTYNDREYEVEVEFEATAATAKQVGAKTIEVTFNKAIDDSKVKFAVKNGIISRDVAKVTVSDDKKKAVVELTTRLQAGDSTVTISGIESEDIVAEFKAEDEKVSQVKFKSNKLALTSMTNFNEVKVGYQILNQFGEEATSSNTPQFMVGKVTSSVTASNGVLTIQTPTTAPFYINETVMISGHLNMGTYVVTFNETLTVGEPATIDSIEFKGIYHPDNKELNTASTFTDYVVLIDAKDQYGNKLDAAKLNANAIFTVSNPSIFQLGTAYDNQGPNKDQVGIQLAAPAYSPGFDGTNTIRIMSYSGKQFSYDVQVTKASTLQKITLSAPSQVVAAGDGTVKIPFVAEDQYGNQLKKYSDLAGKLTLWAQGTTLTLKQDYATKEAYLELAVPGPNPSQTTAIPLMLMATVNGTGQSSQITINIEKQAYPESISGLTSDVAASLAQGATTTIKPDYIKVKDNYGRDKKLGDLLSAGTHKVIVSVADNTQDVVSLSASELVASSDAITVTALSKGNERIKVQLVDRKDVTNPNDDVVVYTFESFVFNVVDNSGIVEYAVEDVPKLSNKPNRQVDLKVVGKRSNGATVVLPTSAYSVTTTNGLIYTGGKLDASAITSGFDSNGELKAGVIVSVFASGQTINKEVVVSNAALRPTTIEQKDANNLKAENGVVKGTVANLTAGGDVIDNIFATLKIKDQFGFEMNPANGDEASAAASQFTATVANIDDVNKNSLTLTVNQNGGSADMVSVTGVEQGDSFTVIFTSKVSGASITLKVVAE